MSTIASFAKLLVLSAGLALPLQAASAQPASPYPVQGRQVALDLQGLNLKDPGAAPMVLARIEAAARHACGIMAERDPAYKLSPQFVTRDFTQCQVRAVAETVARLRQPALSQAYAEAHGPADPHQASSR